MSVLHPLETPGSRPLWANVLIGMGLGVGVGLILSPSSGGLLSADQAASAGGWIALPGHIFLALLVMVVIPLVICSIILGIVNSGSPRALKAMGLRLVPYFIATTAIAVSIGVMLALMVEPGLKVDGATLDSARAIAAVQPPATFDELSVPQRILNLIPTNFAQSLVSKDMLAIVIGSLFIGVALFSIPAQARLSITQLCEAGQAITMAIIDWAMKLAPIAVFGLLADAVMRLGWSALSAIGWYVACVLAGLALMLIIYLLIVTLVARRNPFDFLRAIRAVQLLAFSTSSSAAVMPLSMEAAEEKLGVHQEISRFVIPLGATINMDGTALYQAVAALFLCQIFGVELSAAEIVLLVCTTVGASIGTPAAPGVGVGVLATILLGIGVPPQGVGIILGVDRILDMCRTSVNVTGDLTASVVMDRWMHKSLRG